MGGSTSRLVGRQNALKICYSASMTKPHQTKSNAGRNPTINRESIDAAVRKVGTAGPVSVNKVADELGVNVTTVYRHTGGLEGLKRIHALQAFESLGAAPAPDDKAWRDWLFDLAAFYRNAFLHNPDLLKYAQAALDPRFNRLEQATTVLMSYGFSAYGAISAHAFLINNVVGYVHQELQTKQQRLGGAVPVYMHLVEALKSEPERLPTLNKLNLDEQQLDSENNFNFFMRYALDGIAAHLNAANKDTADKQ